MVNSYVYYESTKLFAKYQHTSVYCYLCLKYSFTEHVVVCV